MLKSLFKKSNRKLLIVYITIIIVIIISVLIWRFRVLEFFESSFEIPDDYFLNSVMNSNLRKRLDNYEALRLTNEPIDYNFSPPSKIEDLWENTDKIINNLNTNLKLYSNNCINKNGVTECEKTIDLKMLNGKTIPVSMSGNGKSMEFYDLDVNGNKIQFIPNIDCLFTDSSLKKVQPIFYFNSIQSRVKSSLMKNELNNYIIILPDPNNVNNNLYFLIQPLRMEELVSMRGQDTLIADFTLKTTSDIDIDMSNFKLVNSLDEVTEVSFGDKKIEIPAGSLKRIYLSSEFSDNSYFLENDMSFISGISLRNYSKNINLQFSYNEKEELLILLKLYDEYITLNVSDYTDDGGVRMFRMQILGKQKLEKDSQSNVLNLTFKPGFQFVKENFDEQNISVTGVITKIIKTSLDTTSNQNQNPLPASEPTPASKPTAASKPTPEPEDDEEIGGLPGGFSFNENTKFGKGCGLVSQNFYIFKNM